MLITIIINKLIFFNLLLLAQRLWATTGRAGNDYLVKECELLLTLLPPTTLGYLEWVCRRLLAMVVLCRLEAMVVSTSSNGCVD